MELGPQLGFFALFSILQLLSSIPIWLLIYDGRKQKNIKKSILYLVGFFGFIIIGNIALNTFGIWLAMAVPFLLVLFLVVSHLIKKS
jgi:small neutral amino acid transporter SnatA (MarC family)